MKRKIKVLIVDDEPLARDNLVLLLQADKEIETIDLCANGFEAIAAIEHHRPDILFLDVQMPKMNGFEVIKSIDASIMPVVVFVTAFDKFAIGAFEANAIDYLLKPFSDQRFRQSLEKAKDQLKQRAIIEHAKQFVGLIENNLLSNDSISRSRHIHRIAVKTVGKIQFLSVEDIDWIEADGSYVKLHSKGKTHLIRDTLLNLETKLNPEMFMRIHRSTIVNIERINEMYPYARGEYVLILKDGSRLKMSRGQKEKLHMLLDGLI